MNIISAVQELSPSDRIELAKLSYVSISTIHKIGINVYPTPLKRDTEHKLVMGLAILKQNKLKEKVLALAFINCPCCGKRVIE